MTFRRTRCPHCKGKMEQGVRIHPECIDAYAEAEEAKAKRKAEKQARAAAKVEKAEDRRRKEALKTIAELIADAQVAFNAFIRERDKDKGCFVCGRPFTDKPGQVQHAGHVRSRGAAGHLRFNEDNCNAQSKQENRFLAGNAIDYRVGLIARIGLARVEALESDNAVKKWTREELIAIRDTYKAKLKEMKK